MSTTTDLKDQITNGRITFDKDDLRKELLGENTGPTKVTEKLQRLVLEVSKLQKIKISSIIRISGLHGSGRAFDIGNEEIAGTLLPLIATNAKVAELNIDEIIFDAKVANPLHDRNKWNYDQGAKWNYDNATLDTHGNHIHLAVTA
jgi:hypothetical protein